MAIAGGGPAGLAMAVHCARLGIRAVVLERSSLPRDKACGEGLMPKGVALLRELGVVGRLSEDDAWPFEGIRYVQEDGSSAEARFASGQNGLGIRRIALAEAMLARAREAGAEVVQKCAVVGHRVHDGGVTVLTEAGEVEASLLIGADGLQSPLRQAAGLDRQSEGPRRYGLRQHFIRPPWSPFVEVHFSPGIEAYVTPVGRSRVCVAFLWESGRVEASSDVAVLLQRFPALRGRLWGAPADSRPVGAGPLERRPRARTSERLALLGDAAGSVDALTGDGVSLALLCAAALAKELPAALEPGGSRAALARYDRAAAEACAPYVRLARLLLFVARRPALRRTVVDGLGIAPWLFERVLASHASAG